MSNHEPFAAPPERPPRQPYEDGPLSVGVRWAKAVQFGLVIICLVITGRMVFVLYSGQPNADASAPAVASVLPLNTPEVEPTKAERAERAHGLEVSATLRQDFLKLVDELNADLDAWQRELDRWAAEIEPLLNNTAGRSLATDAVSAQTFRAIYEQDRPGVARLDQIRVDMQKGVDPIRLASQDEESDLRPDQALVDRLMDFKHEASEALRAWREGRSELLALVARTGNRTGAGGPTLAEAIAADQRVEERRRAEKIRLAVEQARNEAADKLAAAEAEKIRIEGEVKAREILTAAEAGRQQQEQTALRQRQEAELVERRAALEQDLAEVKRYLAPFITKGYAQPSGYFCAQTAVAGPMSYSKIVSAGALKETRDGMQLLVNYATRGNDRDRAGFPTCDGSEYQWAELNKEYVRRAQELLTLYGDLLVEQGLLSH